jgi:hypothetical protein
MFLRARSTSSSSRRCANPPTFGAREGIETDTWVLPCDAIAIILRSIIHSGFALTWRSRHCGDVDIWRERVPNVLVLLPLGWYWFRSHHGSVKTFIRHLESRQEAALPCSPTNWNHRFHGFLDWISGFHQLQLTRFHRCLFFLYPQRTGCVY